MGFDNISRVFIVLAIIFQYSVGDPTCGKSLQKHFQARITNGNDVGYYKYPWFGILKINDKLKCGVTLIDKEYALTAANCFREFLPLKPGSNVNATFAATFGAYDRCLEDEPTRRTFPVRNVYVNSQFVKGKRGGNVALVRLAAPAEGFEAACLPAKPVAPEDRPSEGVIVGLGLTRYRPLTKSCTVREGRVVIYDDAKCKGSLERAGEDVGLLEKGFCAGGVEDTEPYGCGIDLGGPLLVTDNSNVHYILGIISYKKCPDNQNLTLYQDVSKYLDWIRATIALNAPTTSGPTETTVAPKDPDYESEYGSDYDDDNVKPETAAPSPTTTETTTTTTTTTTSTTTTNAPNSGPGIIQVTGKRHGHHETKHHHQKRESGDQQGSAHHKSHHTKHHGHREKRD